MSKFSLSTRSLAIGISVALLAQTAAVSTATAAPVPALSSSGVSSNGSSFIGEPGEFNGYCESDVADYCETDNGVIQARISPNVVANQLTTGIEVEGLQTVRDDLVLNYLAEGIEVTDLVNNTPDAPVTITETADGYRILIKDGLVDGEVISLEATGVITDRENARQSVTAVTGTPADAFIKLVGILGVGVLGVVALIEHLHNIQWLTRDLDQLWLDLTGRDPALTLIK